MKWINCETNPPKAGYYVLVSAWNEDSMILPLSRSDTWFDGNKWHEMIGWLPVKWLDESLPSTGEDDMTAKEFFDSPESPITLDKICTPTEKEFLLDTIEMYANGKVNQALKAASTPPAKDNWIKIEEGGEMPPEHEKVLVHFGDGNILTAIMDSDNKWYLFYSDGRNVEDTYRPVTHWQPLPTFKRKKDEDSKLILRDRGQ